MRFGPYVGELFRRRSYAWYVAVTELRKRQMSSTLGNLWHLLNPVLQVLVYWLIFGLLLGGGIRRGIENYILFLAVGIFMFTDVQRATTAGANSLPNNRSLIRSLHFPRALVPITAVLSEFMATVPSLLVILATAIGTGADPRWTWVLLPLVFVAQFVFDLGAGLVAARLAAAFVDVQQILPFVFRLGMYLSGVIFAVEVFATPAQQRLFALNPIYCFIEIGRWTVLGGSFNGTWLLSATIWTLVLPVAGLWWFQRAEETYSRV